uniref:Reverse transcriptase Ty1/copia-type domain-containing protein n=1 Tax=Physcomitrium patens TaxID=3218 RepID=A0A7I4DRH3_PHYPA
MHSCRQFQELLTRNGVASTEPPSARGRLVACSNELLTTGGADLHPGFLLPLISGRPRRPPPRRRCRPCRRRPRWLPCSGTSHVTGRFRGLPLPTGTRRRITYQEQHRRDERDIDNATNVDDRKSYSRYILFLNGGQISWRAIKLAPNPSFYSQTKYVDIKYHMIKEQIQNGLLQIDYISTHYKVADIFTKPLTPKKFKKMRALPIMSSRKCMLFSSYIQDDIQLLYLSRRLISYNLDREVIHLVGV